MKVTFKRVLTVLALTAAAIAPLSLSGAASAGNAYNTNTKDCGIFIKGSTNDLGKSSSRFTDNKDGTVSATVVVVGKDGCNKDVTISSWRAPYGSKNNLPISGQTLFKTKTMNLPVGVHVVTIEVADCIYQVDLLYGKSPYAPDGWSANYPHEQKLGWVIAGTKVCVKEVPPTPPVTPPVTPPTPEPCTVNPHHDDCKVTCEEATPEKPATNPDECVTPVVVGKSAPMLPEVLPATGVGSVAAIFAVAAVAGTLGYRYFLRRRLSV